MDIVLPALIFLFAFIFAFNNIFEGDTFWHLRLGQYMLATHSLPFHDIFSYTLAGRPVYPVEWLFEVVWFLLYSFTGVAGLIVIKSVIAGLTGILLYLSMIGYKINRFVAFFVVSTVFIAAGFYFPDRPQIITYLGIALFVFITLLYDKGHRKILWLLPIIMLIWVNMHPGAVFGIIFLSGVVLEGLLNLLRKRIKFAAFFPLAAVFVLTCLATLISPNTYHLYSFLFDHAASLAKGGGLKYIAEFMPPSFANTPIMFVGLIVFSLILVIGVLTSLISGTRRLPLRFVIFGIIMIPASFDMRRMVIMALIGIVPGIGIILNEWFSALKIIRKSNAVLATIYALFIILPFGYEFYQYKTDYVGYKGIGVQHQFYPNKAINFILNHRIKGNIYNSINFGGAVIFLGFPEIKDFIDTRLMPERMLLPEVAAAMNDPSAFQRLMNRYNVTYSLVETYVARNYRSLFPRTDWSLVYFDDYAQIYVKRNTGNNKLINEYNYPVFNPYSFLYTDKPFLYPQDYFTTPGLLEDLQRLAKEAPYSGMAHLAYGIALIYNNSDYADGLKQIDKARRIMPYNPRVLLWYGIGHGLNGDTAKMRKSFDTLNTVLKYQEGATAGNIAFINYIMGYYYYVAGLHAQAVKSLTNAIKLNPRLSEAQSLLNRIR